MQASTVRSFRPGFRLSITGLITLISVFITFQPVWATTGSQLSCLAAPGNLTPEESAMLQMVNSARKQAGLEKLQFDPDLARLARAKSRDMVANNYFGHRSPQLGTIYDQLQQTGIVYRIVAENLAGAPGYRRAQLSIMKSPAHRSNVLNPSFTRIGIGIVQGGPYGKMVTQIFTD